MKAISLFKALVMIVLSFVFSNTAGQIVRLEMNIPTSRSLSKLQELEELARGNIHITMTNLTDQEQEFIIEAIMYSHETDFSILTNPDKGVVIRLGRREARTLDYNELMDLFQSDALILADANSTSVEEFLRNDPQGHVPSGNYQLCVRLRSVEMNQQNINSLSNTACSFLKFEHYAQPLINTINGTPCQYGCDFEDLPLAGAPMIVNFTATSFNDVHGFNYRIRIFEATTEDFNQDFLAMQGSMAPNRYIYDQPVTAPASGNSVVEALMPENMTEEFQKGKSYAMVIQATSMTGEQLPNDGFSQVVPFFFGDLMEVAAADPDLDDLPEECRTGDCNNIPLPSGQGQEVAGLSSGDKVRFGCFWVTIKEITKSGSGFNGEGTVVLPFLSAKFRVKIIDATIKKYDNRFVAVAGVAKGLPDSRYPTTGLLAEVTNLFQNVSSGVLDATGGLASGTAAAGAAVNGAVSEATNSVPYDVLQKLYGDQNPVGEVRELVGNTAIILNQVTDHLNQEANDVAGTISNVLSDLRVVDRVAQQILNPDFETGLPIGYASGTGADALRFGVFAMEFSPQRAAVNLVIQTPLIPAINNRLYFGGSGIAISPSDFSLANSTFYLGGDIAVGLAGNAIILKGTGEDGATASGTYLKLKDGGLDEIMFNGEFVFSRQLFLPVAAGTSHVRAILSSSAKHNFEDFIFSMRTNSPFMLRANRRVRIDPGEMHLDLSSSENPGNWSALPAELRTSFGNANQQNAWTGILLQNARIQLPPDFQLGSGGSPSVNLQYFMVGFDGRGVSFSATGRDILTLAGGGKLAGFGFSIATIEVDMLNNEMKKFQFNGQIRTGLFDVVNATRNGGIPYAVDLMDLADENPDDLGDGELPDFAFKLIINQNTRLEISNLYTAFTIGQESYLSFNSAGHEGDEGKKVQFRLNGELSVTAERDGLRLPSMQFQNFFFDGKELKLDDFAVSFASPQKTFGGGFDPQLTGLETGTQAGGFPISLQRFYPVFVPYNENLKLGFGFDIVLNLKEGAGFGLNTGIEITAQVSPALELVPNSFELSFKRIAIETDVSVCHISGSLEFIKNDNVFGNGFRGCISVEMKIPAPIMGQVQGMFGSVKQGNNEFRYFYIEGLLKGLNILIPNTPIAIDGFAGGLYYNMVEERNAPSFAARLNSPDSGCQPPALTPNPTKVGIAIGVMVKEAASAGFSFNGMMSFKAEFNRETFAPEAFTVGGAMRFIKVPGPVSDAPSSRISDPIKIAADVTLTYDFANTVFYGNFNVYLNVAGVLKGKGPNDQAGEMAMYFGKNDWYIYMGNPWRHTSDPGGVLEGMEPYAAVTLTLPGTENPLGEAGAYFCMGSYGISGLPTQLPPINFPSDMRAEMERERSTVFKPGSSSGSGIAFGAYFGFSYETQLGSSSNYVRLHANAGAGFDVALSDYGSTTCGNSVIGINGYYAMGQLYGYVSAGLKLHYDVLLGKGSVDIVSIRGKAKFNFGAPNPTWIDGEVSVSKSALRAIPYGIGLLAGTAVYALEVADLLEDEEDGYTDINFDVSIGAPCRPSSASVNLAADRYGSQSIVSSILPVTRENNSLVLGKYEPVRVILNKPLGSTWRVTKYNTNGSATTSVRQ